MFFDDPMTLLCCDLGCDSSFDGYPSNMQLIAIDAQKARIVVRQFGRPFRISASMQRPFHFPRLLRVAVKALPVINL